jgi:hypothetical protein
MWQVVSGIGVLPRRLRFASGDSTLVQAMANRALQVVRIRDDDADQAPVLVVQDVAERASSAEL